MKKYKVVVSDYDGTLINDSREITPKTLKAINDFAIRGGYFVVCTGRMTTGINHYLKKYNLNIFAGRRRRDRRGQGHEGGRHRRTTAGYRARG